MDGMERVLKSPIFWGVIALAGLAFAMSGKFSARASVVLLWVTFALAIFGIYRGLVALQANEIVIIAVTVVAAVVLLFPTRYAVNWVGAKIPAIPLKVPNVTWENPAPIRQGSPLSDIQLNATSDIPGQFVYSPAAGAVLPAGSTRLSVTFSPADTGYSTQIKTVAITVISVPPFKSLAKIPIVHIAPMVVTGGA